MEEQRWVVIADAKNPWLVARHRAEEREGPPRPACFYRYRHEFRVLAPEELSCHRPCGVCVRPEHDGPPENADAASAAVRGAAAAAAEAVMTLRELGYARAAQPLHRVAAELVRSAERMEFDS